MRDLLQEEPPGVLLVDDVPANLVALEAVLLPLGCHLVKASSATDGLKELLKRDFAVLLLDVQMPHMDGYEMAHLARGALATRDIPIIFITAANQTDDILLHGYGSGAVDVLFKPLNASILRSKVQVFIDLFRTRRHLAAEIATHKATLTDLQASRDEAEGRRAELERAYQDQRELTEFIVHDLKNPLTVAHSSLEFAREHVLPSQPELAETIAEAAEATSRVRAMIEDLLMIWRMEQAAFPMQRQAVNLDALLRAVIQSFARRAQDRGVVLEAPATTELNIVGDGDLLRRVFENILDNALRHVSERGRIAVAVQGAATAISIVVSNDGPGIPAADRPHIFEKFRRGRRDATTTGNAGLGLHFCKRVVEAHGGDIAVVQTEWPTSFRIRLPAAEGSDHRRGGQGGT